MALCGIAKEAVDRAGGARKVAAALGISQPAVAQWGDRIPKGRIEDMARLSGIPLKKLQSDRTRNA